MNKRKKERDIPELRGMSIWKCPVCGHRVERGQEYVECVIWRNHLRARGVAHRHCYYDGEYECNHETFIR